MSVQQQVHNKFKVFGGKTIDEVGTKVNEFTKDGHLAAKSLGVEFVESTGQFLVSIGYAEGQEGYPVAMTEAVAGPLPDNDEAEELCAALEEAAAKAGDVICHEIYVDAESIVHLVFLAKA